MSKLLPIYKQGQIIKYKNLACVVILAWEDNLLISPLASEVQFIVKDKTVAGVLYKKN